MTSTETGVRAPSETDAMRRALEIARRGPANGPNPRVGCVLLSPAGELIGEGWHRGAGTPHAEVAALTDAAERGTSTRGATAVVTLEPCNHTGRTGPCSEALLDAGVARVVVSVRRPQPRRRRGSRAAACRGRRGRDRAAGRRGTGTPGRLAALRRARSPVRHAEDRHLAGRAHRRRRRLEPVDHLGGLAAPRARPARRGRRHRGRHRHRAGRRPVADRTQRRRGAARSTSRCGSSSATATSRRTPACAARAASWSTCGRTTPREVLAVLARARGPAPARRGRPHARRRVPARPGSSTRCTPTSHPSCSAPDRPPWPTSASPRIGDAVRLDHPIRHPARSRRPRRRDRRPAPRPAQPHGGALMFTGIVEEIGTVEAIEHDPDGSGRASAGPRPARRVRRPPGRLDQRLRRLSDGDGAARRRHVLRGRHARDAAAQRAGGRRRVAARSTSSARCRSAAGTAGTSCRGTSTASAPS